MCYKQKCKVVSLNLAYPVCTVCSRYRRSGQEIGNAYGPGVNPIWLDNLGCSGSENALEDCNHAGWGVHNCGHHEDVSIECGMPTTNAPTIGKSITRSNFPVDELRSFTDYV